MSCAFCAAQNSVNEVSYLCGECGLPQPLQPHENFFSVFGLPVRFTLSEAEIARLQSRFYEASRGLHPDRFTRTANTQAQQASVERMSFLNQAWATLKNTAERRQYVLKIEGLASAQQQAGAKNPAQFGSPDSPNSPVSMEIAEDWFELQDLFLEDPAQAKVKSLELKNRIQATQQDLEEKIRANERDWDSAHTRANLESIHRLSQQLNTLRSLERDLLQKEAAL